jgi:hypothetical protein
MLLFLATIVEQLDLALEHVSKRDIHNARFGLMLTDNAVELVLHQIARDNANNLKQRYQSEEYPHQVALEKALLRSFDDKIKFAKLAGNLNQEVAQTINIMHGFRNEVYHIGLQHESILANLALFYFDVACKYLKTYEPRWFGWSSSQKIPDRAKKYFRGADFFPAEQDDFANACEELAKRYDHNEQETIDCLSDHMEEIITNQDTCIDIVARGIYEGQQTTRDKAVIDSQAWPLAFTSEGKAFAAKRGWSGNILQSVDWLADNYPFRFRRDPISSWERQLKKLRSQKNPHTVLLHYHSFMTETANLRDTIEHAAGQVEAEIDSAIDRARGK